MTSLPVTSLPVTSLSVMSHPVAMLLSLMSSGTFCTTTIVRKKRRDALPGMRRTCFRLSRHFRSRDFMWRHFRSGPFPMTSIPVAHAQWPAPLCFPRNMPWAIPIYYFDIWIWGDPIHIPWKINEGRQSSLPLEVYVKGIARNFNWHKCLGRIMHLKPTAGYQISILIFENKLWRGVSMNIPWKIYQGRQSSCPLLAKLKVLQGSLTDLSA
jgi:hypothetical protein